MEDFRHGGRIDEENSAKLILSDRLEVLYNSVKLPTYNVLNGSPYLPNHKCFKVIKPICYSWLVLWYFA